MNTALHDRLGLVLLGLILTLHLGSAAATPRLPQRQHVLIVGSSTAYPIVAAASEYFGRLPGRLTPVVESTGSGGGIKLFCSGIGLSTPDIAMSSRPMKQIERANCIANKVYDIREIKIGYDGIVIANSKAAQAFKLLHDDLYLALAREVPDPNDPDQLIPNPYRQWQQIRADLPDRPIKVLGPPPTSGTRDILLERVVGPACRATPAALRRFGKDAESLTRSCHALREDGAFVESGENDARVVRKLISDTDALGVIGYSYLDQNRHRLQAASIDGVLPEFELIESGVYPLSRPLFIYTKPRHARLIADLEAFVATLISPAVSGPDGFLADHGLVPLPGELHPSAARISH